MSEDEFLKIQVDRKAPFKVPDREGCLLEIGYPMNGMNVMIQYPNLSPAELITFQSPLVSYSYYESETIIPIAYWIFRFPRDTFVETTFNACFALNNPGYLSGIQLFLEDMNNAVSMLILDAQIVKGMRIIGLHVEAIEMFHRTLKKQLEMNFSREDYMVTMRQMENVVSSEEIFNMGTVFTFSQ